MAMSHNNPRKLGLIRGLILLPFFITALPLSHSQTKNSCVECHSLLSSPLDVTQETFSHDIHAQKGLTCVSCHGGDETSGEPDKAMAVNAGWKGKRDRRQIPQLCGSCLSDPVYMRQFNPGLRT